MQIQREYDTIAVQLQLNYSPNTRLEIGHSLCKHATSPSDLVTKPLTCEENTVTSLYVRLCLCLCLPLSLIKSFNLILLCYTLKKILCTSNISQMTINSLEEAKFLLPILKDYETNSFILYTFQD